MAAGTPIRLVQENGDLIELEAQTMVMTTSRKVGGSAMPLTGSRRIGLDMNVNSAMINVQGIITDDREESGATSATSLLNFGRGWGTKFGQTWATHANWDNMFDRETVVSLYLTSTDGTAHQIKFKRQTSGVTAYTSNGISSGPGILLADSGNTADPAVVATAFNTYIGNHLSSYFTSTIKSDISVTSAGEATANVAVEVRQVTTGYNGNNLSPHWAGDGGKFFSPATQKFSGGTNAVLKSAGDKVQDIYGILNNSTTKAGRMAAGVALGALAGAAIVLTAGMAAPAIAGTAAVAGAAGGGAAGGSVIAALAEDKARQDYICGIQIPFNSKIKATDGELYSVRNFFMPTGYGQVGMKGSESSNPASTKFSHDAKERSGIQGAVQKMDITFDAGETVYTFNLIFAPIDNLL
jgi:hypothetical protein